MKKVYLVEESIYEDADDIEDYEYCTKRFVCETRELANKMMSELKQEAADRLMDSIDVMGGIRGASLINSGRWRYTIFEIDYYGF